MKHTKFFLTLFALMLASLSMSCGTSNSTNPANVNATPPTPVVSSPEPPRSGTLVQATSKGDVSYQLAGTNGNAKMNLTVVNKTETVWELKVERGTKLEPSEGNVQQMVITEEYEVHLEPHEEEKLEIEVSCLDISKKPPAVENTSWGIKSSNQLARFISCAKARIVELERKGEIKKEERHALLQLAVWKARGATRDDFIHVATANDATVTEAAAELDQYEPLIIEAVSGCQSLVNLD